MEYFDFFQSYKRKNLVMTPCRTPENCEHYKIDIEIYDPKSKRILPRNVKQRDICVHIHENHCCVFRKKNRKIVFYLLAIKEIDIIFKYVENIINENNLKQRIHYILAQHETIDQLENVFVLHLETITIKNLLLDYLM